METFSNQFPSRRCLAPWCLLLFCSVTSSVFAQTNPITNYSSLLSAINGGITNITNFPGSAVIYFTNGNPTVDINSNVTINGGANSVILQGDSLERFFNVHSKGVLTLDNLYLTGGSATNGGAIYNDGTLIISNCILQGNVAASTNGADGISVPSGFAGNGGNGSNAYNAAGGAIFSTGPLIISYSILTNNSVEAGDGGNGGSANEAIGSGGNAGYGGNALGGAVYSSSTNNIFYMTEFLGNVAIAGDGGTGGFYATNSSNPTAIEEGLGGAAGLGGYSAGGGVFLSGQVNMSNCLFANNLAAGGTTSPAEMDADGGGADGSPGGSAYGGGLFITNGVSSAYMTNCIFYFNACEGGAGGSTGLNAAYGGLGGAAVGGGIWNGALHTELSLSTIASNALAAGSGGANTNGGINGTNGGDIGWEIFSTAGTFDLNASIVSFNAAGGSYPNLIGVTDTGYNVCSDSSLTRNSLYQGTLVDKNPLLGPALETSTNTNAWVGGIFSGMPMFTLGVLTNSPAIGLVPGVPGVTFPATDIALYDRSTPTTAGAFEFYYILPPIPTNAVMPTIVSTVPGTNLSGSGHTVYFTNTVNASNYDASNPLPYGYQWQLFGTNIYDGTNYAGTQTNILAVKNITFNQQGYYTVLVSPTLLEGAVTSSPVALILTNPPTIKSEPISRTRPYGSIVTFSANVPYALDFYYQWTLNGTNVPTTNEFSGTDSDVLMIDPATYGDEGFYQMTVTNNYGSKTTTKARLIIVPDIERPTITITNPAANNLRSNNFTFGGVASDNAQVTNVYFWITNINAGLGVSQVTNLMSGSAVLTTNGNTNYDTGPNKKLWSITNVPLPGSNILVVQAVDYSSNVSTLVSRKFFYKVPATLTLSNVNYNGASGTFVGRSYIPHDTAPSNNAELNIGEGYSVTAKLADINSLLGSWTNVVGSNVFTTNATIDHFIMESNLAIYASFVTNIFVGVHGSYNGLFYVTNQGVFTNYFTNLGTSNDMGTNVTITNAYTNVFTNSKVALASAGAVRNLMVSDVGQYSGQLLLAGDTYNLRGTFDGFGVATNEVVNRPGQTPLIVNMNMDTNGAGIITGTVAPTNGTFTSYLWADLAASTLTGDYTLLMTPSSNNPASVPTPPGDCYALISAHNGKATLSGGLADGTTFSESSPISKDEYVPVYVGLYSKAGLLFGWLNLTNLNVTNAADGLIWIKQPPARPTALYPDGFTNMLQLSGSPWANPGVITLPASNTLTISNAGLDLNYTVAVDGKNRLVNATSTPANSLSGSINLQNGLMQITFGNGNGNRTTRGYGAILQNTTNAGGYFVTTTNSGLILLQSSTNQ